MLARPFVIDFHRLPTPGTIELNRHGVCIPAPLLTVKPFYRLQLHPGDILSAISADKRTA